METTAPAQRLATNFVSFTQVGAPQPIRLGAKLQVPIESVTAGQRLPAVVIVHGTTGVDSRGTTMAAALNAAGIATLEIDQWWPRGVTAIASRPKDPFEAVRDVFGAFEFLAAHPAVDAARIGITGFSWGGVMGMLAAQAALAEGLLGPGRRFAAHLLLYPVCWLYNSPGLPPLSRLTGAPVRILTGADDHYDDDPEACAKLVERLSEADRAAVSFKVYPGAMHGFDMLEDCTPPYDDPFAFRGRGGMGRSCPEPKAREDSRREAAAFFKAAFGLS